MNKYVSIQKKIISLIIFFSLITALGYTAYVITITRKNIAGELEQHAQLTGYKLRESLAIPVWDFNTAAIEQILFAAMNDRNLAAISVKDTTGTFSVCFVRTTHGDITSCESPPVINSDFLKKSFPVTYKGKTVGILETAFSGGILKSNLRTFTQHLVISTLILLLVICILVYHSIYRTILEPLRNLSRDVCTIADGNFTPPIRKRSNDEIGMLAGNIESMRQSIKSMTDSLEKSRDEAQKRESYIHLILKNSNDIIQINDAQGNILFASQSLTRILGYPLSELQYKSALEFIHPDDRDLIINDLDMIVNNPGKSIQEEYRYRHKKGHWVHLEAIACNLFHEPAIQGILLNIRDITKRKNAEEEHQRMRDTIHHSQKMEAVGKLAGGIAHDFNNAISGIMSAVELIAIEETTPEEIREYSDLILTSAQNAGDLTKKLLTFTRKRTTAHAPLEIEQVLNDTSNILHHTVDKSIHISSPKTTDKACIMGDSAVIQNALINLGINGAHAMPQGGTLTFTVENMYLDREYCSHSPFDISPGDYVRISVADTGCGMSPEVTARIFEPFFTTKKEGEGTGLGLAAVYGTVQEHRGAITVYSEEGAGTVFHLYFPRTKQCSTGKNEAEIPYRGEGTILLIDDEEIIRKTGAGILKTMGYTVFTAKNGHKGVELFSAKQSEIDLVILDMIMPVMGGNRAFELLRVRNPHIPIIICSGFSKEDDFKRMQTQGKVMFLSKPFRKKELARAVFEILGAHRTE